MLRRSLDRLVLVPVASLGLLGACSEARPPAGDDGVSSLTTLETGQTETTSMEGNEAEAEAEAEAGTPCTTDQDCAGGEVCGPASGECVPEG
ncbi:MAG TPA: hypothetical protein VK034_22135, partial [Enhygromyxa sp.]|nr:hypothetical protein [Enhygromyxa sp.]